VQRNSTYLLLCCRGDEIISNAVDKHGHPVTVLKKHGTKYQISVMSLEQMESVMNKAGSKKLTEARHCLESTFPISILIYSQKKFIVV